MFHCNRCGFKRTGRVYRDLYEWRARLKCGHERQLGMTKPLDVLEQEGLINVDEVMDRKSTDAVENMTDTEYIAWQKKVKTMSTRGKTLY